jgi:beta-glucuronidase
MKQSIILLTLLCAYSVSVAQESLITNISSRKKISLNGTWSYIVDPYETGFYDYRLEERNAKDPLAYWNTDAQANKSDRKEHGYNEKYTLKVPGDWNSQDPKFLYYEGSVWYKRSFDLPKPNAQERIFLHFGAVNYKADVYLNGNKLGVHKGGFTPFNFEIPANLLKEKDNWLVVKVDNKRMKDEVPTVNTDWWNYGGITRDVNLVFVSSTFIRDYSIQLAKRAYAAKEKWAEGWIKLSNPVKEDAWIEIPELKIQQKIAATGDSIRFRFKLNNVQLWSTQNPKLYKVIIRTSADRVEDNIGFRNVETNETQVLVNGKPVFLRGICIHEEIPQEMRRAYSKKDALYLLGQVKELNANMVRLAHYPHNEHMIRTADSLGILVWSEIPVYWTIDFTSTEVLNKAKAQLREMITRDRNRASVIIWSVGNETPVHEARTKFMSNLAKTAKALDSTRLISAALEIHWGEVETVEDPLGEFTDLLAVNEYIGWYGGLPDKCRTITWKTKYKKPFFISETGAEALGGYHADSLTIWSEEFQEWFYKEQVGMMKRMPDNFVGLAPWLLNDFRSPRRNNPVYQEGWNNKGLYDQKGRKKKAFYIMKAYYDEMEQKEKRAQAGKK